MLPAPATAGCSLGSEGCDAHRKTAEYDCGKCPSHRSPHVAKVLGERLPDRINPAEQGAPGDGIRRDRSPLPAALDAGTRPAPASSSTTLTTRRNLEKRERRVTGCVA